VDEAGRGPLAGPVFAAAVVLDSRCAISGLADSKALAARTRAALAQAIRERAVAWAVAEASVKEIDRLNILQASLLAMRRAVERLAVAPDEVLVDGPFLPRLAAPARAIVRGDATVEAIAAASILAKVERDRAMERLHRLYPRYGFDRNKGYPTAAHLAALRAYGVSPAHRKSFAPVRALLEGSAGA
jgi:ribonuclease HII